MLFVHALRLDVIGPEPDEPQAAETLDVPPSRWYLTGYLVPAPVNGEEDGNLLEEPGDMVTGDDDQADPETGKARVVVKEAVGFNQRQKPAFVLNPHYRTSGSADLNGLLGFEVFVYPEKAADKRKCNAFPRIG